MKILRAFLSASCFILLSTPYTAHAASSAPHLDASTQLIVKSGAISKPADDQPADVFNVMNYGAKCDGVTNDDRAVNDTVSAAYNSAAYRNNNPVRITGPAGKNTKGCVINSVNATMFNSGTGANNRPRVEIDHLSLLCAGAGNICLDATGADLLKVHDISIRGDSVNIPEECIQVAVQSPSARSSAWHNFDRVQCDNTFAFAAFYNFGSEHFNCFDCEFTNANTTNGAIATLGTIAGGSAYTNGAYTDVPLIGGSGNGALATLVVSDGKVTSVTVTYQGRDYKQNDVLSVAAPRIGGSGAGFSVRVSTIQNFAVVLDGQNHWRAQSAFTAIMPPTETWQSLTLVNFFGGYARNLGSGDAMWLGWTGGLHTYNYYMFGKSSCVDVFDNGVTKGGIPGPNWGLDLDFNCEGATTSAINLTGSNASPSIQSLRLRGYNLAQNTFSADSNVTSATLKDADIDLKFGAYDDEPVPIFASAKLWTISGNIAVPYASNWNAPNSFQGHLIVGALASPPQFGPVDLIGSAAGAWSCSRQLSHLYNGPLCNVVRASDSMNIDLYPDSNGNLDRTAYQAFCNNTACTVAVLYDQSGNGNNCTQATAANRPALSRAFAPLGSRPSMQFGDASAIGLTCPAETSIKNIFSTGGYATVVAYQSGDATETDRVLVKSNGGDSSSESWDFRLNSGGASQSFEVASSTSDGIWATNSPGTGAKIYDIQYDASSLRSVPVIANNGIDETLTPTRPVGPISSDAAYLTIGNEYVTGNRGYPGDISEVILWPSIPSAAQLEAVRRNEASYYALYDVN